MFKFFAGVLTGCLIAALVLLSFLPGVPSNAISKYPIAKTHLPTKATEGLKPDILGLDLYWNTRESPVFTGNMTIPLKKSTSYRISTRDDGEFTVRDSAWVEYQGKLYPVFTYEKVFKKYYMRYFKVHKTWEISAERMLTIQVNIPEFNIQERFGPFKLFGEKINYSSE